MEQLTIVLGTVAEPSLPPWWDVLVGVVYFVALAAVVGGSVLFLAVVRPVLAATVGPAEQGAGRRRGARTLAWTGPVLLLGAYLLVASRIARADPATSYARALHPPRIWSFLTTPPGTGAWVSTGNLAFAQNVLFVLAAAVLLSLFRHERATLAAATALALAVCGSLVISVPKSAQSVDDTVNWTRVWQRFSSVALVAGGWRGCASHRPGSARWRSRDGTSPPSSPSRPSSGSASW